MHKSYIRRFHANEIFHRIRIEPQISQKDIVTKTGFDKSTVSSIVNRFDELGLIKRSTNAAGTKPGRPAEGLSISPNKGVLVGIQVERATLSFAISGLDGQPVLTQQQSFDGQIDKLARLVAKGIEQIKAAVDNLGDILAVGVSLPGLVADDGTLVHAPALNWHEIPILQVLGDKVPYPLFVGNDVKAAAMAEHMFGDCVDEKDFIYLFSGSGVGGALFLKGELYGGAKGLAGELGHVKVVPQGRMCSCGSYGCLSAYLSRQALALEIQQLGFKDVVEFSDILKLAAEGDMQVLGVLDRAATILGAAVANYINIFNPPLVMLGGDLARGETYFRTSLESEARRLSHQSMFDQTRIAFSKMSASKGYLGGVALALDGVTGLDGAHVLP
ncbi:Transcriptional regulator, ROK family [Devosia sp. LC5]|uniref:ROK family transcriptional regulator n=1 Tax=Devosia sp. LC5 TaxID=1502724 RepID=UPI0004E3924E|nr:ROK family transcriptional regulator [Devosia sp. LC5]KFC68191.1 Transcriptional regulator, ROK family [Devosia sp. LC5]